MLLRVSLNQSYSNPQQPVPLASAALRSSLACCEQTCKYLLCLLLWLSLTIRPAINTEITWKRQFFHFTNSFNSCLNTQVQNIRKSLSYILFCFFLSTSQIPTLTYYKSLKQFKRINKRHLHIWKSILSIEVIYWFVIKISSFSQIFFFFFPATYTLLAFQGFYWVFFISSRATRQWSNIIRFKLGSRNDFFLQS